MPSSCLQPTDELSEAFPGSFQEFGQRIGIAAQTDRRPPPYRCCLMSAGSSVETSSVAFIDDLGDSKRNFLLSALVVSAALVERVRDEVGRQLREAGVLRDESKLFDSDAAEATG